MSLLHNIFDWIPLPHSALHLVPHSEVSLSCLQENAGKDWSQGTYEKELGPAPEAQLLSTGIKASKGEINKVKMQ